MAFHFVLLAFGDAVLFLLALSVLSVATVGSVVVYQRQATARLKGKDAPLALAAPPPPAVERTFESLQAGDVVVCGDEDWIVRQRAEYDEEGERWWLYALDAGDSASVRRFLEVRRQDGTEVAMLSVAEDAPLFGQLGQGLTFRRDPYILQARGDARLLLDTRVDAAGLKEGRLSYSRYEGPGGLRLIIEEQGGQRRAYAGELVAKKTFSLMPGDISGVGKAPDLDDELEALAGHIENRRPRS